MSLQTLPTDIIIEISKHLNVSDIDSLYYTNMSLQGSIKDNSLYIYSICKHIQPHGLIRNWWYTRRAIRPSSRRGELLNKRFVDTRQASLLAKKQSSPLREACLDWICSTNREDNEKSVIKSEIHYLDGKKNGECKRWYDNGRLAKCCFYINNKLHGEYRYWNTEGQLLENLYYINDKLNGEFRYWCRRGTLLSHGFHKNDSRHGNYKKWYSNGQLCSCKFYDHGILEGDYKRWHSDGNFHYHKVYLNGECINVV